jgi:hypothetical protein
VLQRHCKLFWDARVEGRCPAVQATGKTETQDSNPATPPQGSLPWNSGGVTLLLTARPEPLKGQVWGQGFLGPVTPCGVQSGIRGPSEQKALNKQTQCLSGEGNGSQMLAGLGAWEPAVH